MEIRQGIGDEFREQAAIIYWDAFAQKLQNVLGPEKRGRAYFLRTMISDRALIAYDGDQLLGMVGFDIGQGGLIREKFGDMFMVYGPGAIWRGALMTIFVRQRVEGYLQIDGVAVRDSERGKGVGTALITALGELAIKSKCEAMCLDVVDTNPRARKLYENLGFEPMGKSRLGILRRVFNFRYAQRMVKPLKLRQD